MASHDSPPTYAESEQRVRRCDQDTCEAQTVAAPQKNPSSLSPFSRIFWPTALILPTLAVGLLLYLSTCSSEEMRPDLSVISIALQSNDFGSIFQSAGSFIQGNSTSTGNASSTASVDVVMRSSDSLANTGDLSLGPWGWCVRSTDAQG